jgi:hypothetical protein
VARKKKKERKGMGQFGASKRSGGPGGQFGHDKVKRGKKGRKVSGRM